MAGRRPLLQDHRGARRNAAALAAGAAALLLLVVLPVSAGLVQAMDEAVHRWAVRAEWGPGVGFAKVLDVLGSTVVTTPVMFGVAAWLAVRRRAEALTTWVVAMAVSQLLIGPLKALVDRSRPPGSLVATGGASFPSGHAVAGAAIAVTLAIVLVPAGRRRRRLELAAGIFAVVMAVSRVYLRAHWLSDALGGVAIGAAVGLGAAALVHGWSERKRLAAGRPADAAG